MDIRSDWFNFLDAEELTHLKAVTVLKLLETQVEMFAMHTTCISTFCSNVGPNTSFPKYAMIWQSNDIIWKYNFLYAYRMSEETEIFKLNIMFLLGIGLEDFSKYYGTIISNRFSYFTWNTYHYFVPFVFPIIP